MTAILTALLLALSGTACTLLVDGEQLESVPDSGADSAREEDNTAPDASVIVDATFDAPPPAVCDPWTDVGCNSGENCKNPDLPECLSSTGNRGEYEGCSFASDCATGLGCYDGGQGGLCVSYCDDDHTCDGGECVDGYCTISC